MDFFSEVFLGQPVWMSFGILAIAAASLTQTLGVPHKRNRMIFRSLATNEVGS